jgi:hypothetical protein
MNVRTPLTVTVPLVPAALGRRHAASSHFPRWAEAFGWQQSCYAGDAE